MQVTWIKKTKINTWHDKQLKCWVGEWKDYNVSLMKCHLQPILLQVKQCIQHSCFLSFLHKKKKKATGRFSQILCLTSFCAYYAVRFDSWMAHHFHFYSVLSSHPFSISTCTFTVSLLKARVVPQKRHVLVIRKNDLMSMFSW